MRRLSWTRPLAIAAGALAPALILACSPKNEPVPVLGGQKTASASASPGLAPPSPLPSGLPAALPVPPMGVRGSTRATVKDDPSAKCTASHEVSGQRPEEALKKLSAACNLRPASPVFSGTLADGEPHKEWAFRAKGGHCYRLLSARDAAVQDLVVVLRDGKGDVAAIGPESAVPAGAKVCFEADDDTTVLVSAGTGRGAFAVQVAEP